VATVYQVWQGLENQIATAMAGTNPLTSNAAILPAPIIGVDWPPVNALQAVASGNSVPIITIFDRGSEKNQTKAINLFYALPPTYPTPGASISLSSTFMAPSNSVTVTGSGTPAVNDAFCFTLISGSVGQTQVMAEYIVSTVGTTLITALIAFTAQINTLSEISASLSGNTITITNNSQAVYTVRSEVTGKGYYTQEGFRWLRDVQVILWTNSPMARGKYGDVLEQLFSQLEVNYGFIASDQSACRVLYTDDLVHKDSQLQDIFRRDFMLQIDYPVLHQTPAYPIEVIPQAYESPVPEN
jgi:hypothetical protein